MVLTKTRRRAENHTKNTRENENTDMNAASGHCAVSMPHQVTSCYAVFAGTNRDLADMDQPEEVPGEGEIPYPNRAAMPSRPC